MDNELIYDTLKRFTDSLQTERVLNKFILDLKSNPNHVQSGEHGGEFTTSDVDKELTREEFDTLRKQCDKRFMKFIDNDWTYVEGLKMNQKLSVPANAIAPDTLGEWNDAKSDGSFTDKPIEIYIGYEEIVSVKDGHNRLKAALKSNPKQLIDCIWKGKR